MTPFLPALTRNVLFAMLMTTSLLGCSSAKTTPQLLGTETELKTYPPICVKPEDARLLVQHFRYLAEAIAALNGTINRRHGSGTVAKECGNGPD